MAQPAMISARRIPSSSGCHPLYVAEGPGGSTSRHANPVVRRSLSAQTRSDRPHQAVLHIHRAERADALVDALRALLAEPPADPFAPDLVAVPTKGMERWLAQRLSDRLGICANVEFPSPGRVAADAVATASGIAADEDPWRPERMVWPLLDVVDGC